MPEGDTIFRTAESLRRWLQGRTVTKARTVFSRVPIESVVGSTVDRVEPRGKHLLITFSNGAVLHSHMRMTGSWHVYPTGERWKRPAHQARLVLECGDRVAVCFNAPVIELLKAGHEHEHPALGGLGPDVLDPAFDIDEVLRRVVAQPPDTTIGELLLDQRVAAGIGNIYRCEALFVAGLHPWATVGDLGPDRVREVVLVAAKLMRSNTSLGGNVRREMGGGPGRPWVYGRSGQPCRRCSTTVLGSRLGEQARSVYWCPRCQPDHRPPTNSLQ